MEDFSSCPEITLELQEAGESGVEENFNEDMGDVDLGEVISYVTERWNKDGSLSEIHGMSHWRRVEKNGLRLWTEGVHVRVVRLFAYFHDFLRKYDGNDEDHGYEAAGAVKNLRDSLLKDLSDEEFKELVTACALHTDVLRTGNITVDTCFDADRLDLRRVGITPRADRMATAKGRKLVQEMYGSPFQEDD